MTGFWIFMLIVNLIIPITMIVLGRHYIKNVSKEINSGGGYRTTMSMKNRDTWRFAQTHCGKMCTRYGCGLLPTSIVSMMFMFGKDINTVGLYGGIVCILQGGLLILSVLNTERELKKTFDKNGNRRRNDKKF